MFVDLTNDGQSLCISIAGASLSKGMQAQQTQVVLFLLKICLGCFQCWPACLLGIHADTPGTCIGQPNQQQKAPLLSCTRAAHTCRGYGSQIVCKLYAMVIAAATDSNLRAMTSRLLICKLLCQTLTDFCCCMLKGERMLQDS